MSNPDDMEMHDWIKWARMEIESLQARVDAMQARLDEFDGIVAESRGVYGWHLNGDLATWEELELTPAGESDEGE